MVFDEDLGLKFLYLCPFVSLRHRDVIMYTERMPVCRQWTYHFGSFFLSGKVFLSVISAAKKPILTVLLCVMYGNTPVLKATSSHRHRTLTTYAGTSQTQQPELPSHLSTF